MAANPEAQEVYVHFAEDILDAQVKALIKVMVEIANQGIPRVVLCLATDGGNIVSGIHLYNMLRSMPFHLVIHAVADVSSAGNIVFVAGDERAAATHASFMFHEPTRVSQGEEMNVKTLRELAGQLQANGDRNRAILEERTQMTQNEINALKRGTKTVDANEAVNLGLATRVEDLQIPVGAVTIAVTI